MSPRSIIILSLAGVILVSAGSYFLLQRSVEDSEVRPASAPNVTLPPGERLRDDWPAEEVFRRAFWRNPTAGDKILHAVRLEGFGDDGVKRWGWFIKLHPSPELLQGLRDPSNFGLMPATKPHPYSDATLRAPDWYLPPQGDAGTEILQHPTLPLTIHYRASDNVLYASDHGKGFAKSVSN